MLVQKPKSVVHIVERLAPGGIETFVVDLLRNGSPDDRVFSLQGTVPDLVSSWHVLDDITGRIDAFGKDPGIQPALVRRLAGQLRARRPHAVVLHHIGPLFYGGIAAKLAGVKRILYVEHDAWHYRERSDRILASACLRLLRPNVIAVSKQVRLALAQIMPDIAVTVIPPGVATDRFLPGDKTGARKRLGLPIEAQIVGSAGRLVPVKAHHILLQAISQLPPGVACAIAGDGPELNNLRTLAHNLDLGERIHFLGHRDDLSRVYPAFDVFCLPSEAEGLPRTVLEAQACGVPVVATAVGGIAEALHPQTSALVPPSNPRALAEALAAILSKTGALPSPRGFIDDNMSLTATAAHYRTLCLQ